MDLFLRIRHPLHALLNALHIIVCSSRCAFEAIWAQAHTIYGFKSGFHLRQDLASKLAERLTQSQMGESAVLDAFLRRWLMERIGPPTGPSYSSLLRMRSHGIPSAAEQKKRSIKSKAGDMKSKASGATASTTSPEVSREGTVHEDLPRGGKAGVGLPP